VLIFLNKIYSIKGLRQCEPVGCVMIGESYHLTPGLKSIIDELVEMMKLIFGRREKPFP
jgi:hypothetical protein